VLEILTRTQTTHAVRGIEHYGTPITDTHTRTVVRLYADDAGESRFECLRVPVFLNEFAPPAAPLYVTDPQPETLRHRRASGWPGWNRSTPSPGTAHDVLLGRHCPHDSEFCGNAVIRSWRLRADGGYNGQRSPHRGHIGRASKVGDDPARLVGGLFLQVDDVVEIEVRTSGEWDRPNAG
jgi:hypothetical protein